MTQEATRWS